MIVELQCPDCGKKHFFDVDIYCKVKMKFENEEEAKQFILENTEFKGVMKTEDVLNNL